MCGSEETPFSRLSCSSQGSHFKQKSQFTRPLLRKFGNFSLYSLNFFTEILAHKPLNLEIFSSQAPKFGNFQFTSPQIWKFSVYKPHTLEIQAAHPYLKKSRVPPPGNIPLTIYSSKVSWVNTPNTLPWLCRDANFQHTQHKNFNWWAKTWKL